VEKALINAVLESYLQGVSTRRIQDIVSRLGIENLSESSVSRISEELDEKVEEFLKRPIVPRSEGSRIIRSTACSIRRPQRNSEGGRDSFSGRFMADVPCSF
jgi:transposase-like protein